MRKTFTIVVLIAIVCGGYCVANAVRGDSGKVEANSTAAPNSNVTSKTIQEEISLPNFAKLNAEPDEEVALEGDVIEAGESQIRLIHFPSTWNVQEPSPSDHDILPPPRALPGQGNANTIQPVPAGNEYGPGVGSYAGADPSCSYCNSTPYRHDLAGPARLPSAPEYRIRGGDSLRFIFNVVRAKWEPAYRLTVGDVVRIASDTHQELNSLVDVPVLFDGTISVNGVQSISVSGKTLVEAKKEIERRLTEEAGLEQVRVTILPVNVYPKVQDLLNSVDARAGTGGQGIVLTVPRDGSVSLPAVGHVCVVGLTKEEVAREMNARLADYVHGIRVTVNIEQQAPAFVYVLGEVTTPGRVEARQPLTLWQAISMAGGHKSGANLKSVVILRRTVDWQLEAIRVDLSVGNQSTPENVPDMFLWDTDIVIVPKMKIQRVDELIDLYLTRGVYAVAPQTFFFDTNNSLIQQ